MIGLEEKGEKKKDVKGRGSRKGKVQLCFPSAVHENGKEKKRGGEKLRRGGGGEKKEKAAGH